MDFHKIAVLAFLLFILPFKSFSQTGKLRISIYHDSYYETPCFYLTVTKESDTIHSETILCEDEIVIDSLFAGEYKVKVQNCREKSDEVVQSMTQIVEVKQSQMAESTFEMFQYISYYDIDPITSEEIVLSRTEIQVAVFYFDYKWSPDGNNPKFNYGANFSQYYWDSSNKHVGFLAGGGFGFNIAPLRSDSSFSAQFQEEIKHQYYNYWYGQFDVKIRFTSFNQQNATAKPLGLVLDIGALYNLPIFFKRVSRFDLSDKVQNSFIHQYSDVRLYANFGIRNFKIYGSYRPFDFVKGDLPELPQYNAGVKFSFDF